MPPREPDVLLSRAPESAGNKSRQRQQSGALDGESCCRILFISAVAADHDSLRRILNERVWRITGAFSCQQALACLCRDRIAVIICERHFPDGTWKDILSHIAGLTDPPTVIVTSRVVEEDLRAEVRALGGFGVLSKPFVAEEVGHLLSAAWKHQTTAVEPAPA